MKQSAWVLALAIPLAGCAATASQSWRSHPSEPAVNITGEQGMWGNTIISINDQRAMEGKISYWSGAGDLEGSWEGKPVAARCKKGRGSQVRTQCVVTIDGRRATTLYFRVK